MPLALEVPECALLSQLLRRRLDQSVTPAKVILEALGRDVDLGWRSAGDLDGLLALHGPLAGLVRRLLHGVPGAPSWRSAGTRRALDTSLDEHARVGEQSGLLLGLLVVELHGARGKQGSVFA